MSEIQDNQIVPGPGGENTDEVIAAHGGMDSYFNKITSGDIGNQNLNVGGGYGSAAWGGNGTDGDKLTDELRTNPKTNYIPMVAYSTRAFGPNVNICPINEHMNELYQTKSNGKEGFYKDISEINSDDLQGHGVDYVARERFASNEVISNKEAITYSVSVLIIVLFWVFVGIVFYIIYVKQGYSPKITQSIYNSQ